MRKEQTPDEVNGGGAPDYPHNYEQPTRNWKRYVIAAAVIAAVVLAFALI